MRSPAWRGRQGVGSRLSHGEQTFSGLDRQNGCAYDVSMTHVLVATYPASATGAACCNVVAESPYSWRITAAMMVQIRCSDRSLQL